MDFSDLYECFKEISEVLRYGNLSKLDTIKHKNKSLDDVNEIDMLANDIIGNFINKNKDIVGYISEENDCLIFKDNLKKEGKNYIMTFDPIDGSKNVNSNITCGSIYCIMEYDCKTDKIVRIEEAGYCIYGAKTILLTAKYGNVKLFELNRDNEFSFIKNIYKIPEGKVYHCNESYSNILDEDIKQIIQHYKNHNYSLRYIGSIVADCHQIISNGGLFIYSHNRKYPDGKIRYYYEALPLSYIFSQIGGYGLDSSFNNLLDHINKSGLHNTNAHKRVPIILCNKIDFEYMKEILHINSNLYC
jgi:fructose-1,6-bisphosphatase I